ncbi:hypothetical protein BGZ94_007914 [Podila epigama]|nr:hypothetical protein BGZ94_007914 [Podila epigama]
MTRQDCRFGDKTFSVEVADDDSGIDHVWLQDIQDVLPGAVRLEIDGKPVRFATDEKGKSVMDVIVAAKPSSSSSDAARGTTAATPLHASADSPATSTASTQASNTVSTPSLVPSTQDAPVAPPPYPCSTQSPGYVRPDCRSLSSAPRYVHLAARPILGPEEDWREFLQLRAIRMGLLIVVSVLTTVLHHLVYGQLRYAELPWAIYWHVVHATLFVLSIVWFLMLVGIAVEVVWYLIRTPLATKKSMYQRLFDF